MSTAFSLTAPNAKILDRIIQGVSAGPIIVQIDQFSIKIQIVSEDKSILCDIVLSDDFFHKIVRDSSQKRTKMFSLIQSEFYKPGMYLVYINITKLYLNKKWPFSDFTLSKQIFMMRDELLNIQFSPKARFSLQYSHFYEILRYFNAKTVQIVIRGFQNIQVISIENQMNTVVDVPILGYHVTNDDLGFNENLPITFELQVSILKKIFYKDSDGFVLTLVIDDIEGPLNFVLKSEGYTLSYFVAVYS